MDRRRNRTVALFLLWLAAVAAPMAQLPDRTTPLFTREAIARAAARDTSPVLPQDSRTDWSRLRQNINEDIVVFTQGMAGRKGRLVSVDDATLTVIASGSPGATLVIPRTDITEVRQQSGRRRSPVGAVIGVLAGGALGIWSAGHLAYRQCGGSCEDEKLLIGAALVGLPIAGGVVGYRLGERQLTTIYLKP
jgi:hypothetical protein